MGQSIQEWIKQHLWKTAFKKAKKGYLLQIYKGYLLQISFGPFLNTLSQMFEVSWLRLCSYRLLCKFQGCIKE